MALSTIVKYSYGVGHIFNDLCASMWFTYLLVYLHYVLQLSRSTSGFLLMVGQVADAVATPLIGLQSDRGQEVCGYGRRKTWHAIGTMCVVVTFPFIFVECAGCADSLYSIYIFLLLLAICLFQFGWAAVQVSHMALSLDLVDRESEREELNLIRYIFYVSSEVTLSFVAWVTFMTMGRPGDTSINPGDSYSFEVITITVIGVGLIFSGAFHALTPEPRAPSTHDPWGRLGHYGRVASTPLPHYTTTGDEEAPPSALRHQGPQRAWQEWLRDEQFYVLCLLYTASRLISNLASIYTPIYVAETLHDRRLIALVPLVMALSGVAASFLLKVLRRVVGRKGSLVVGVVVGGAACTVAALPGLPPWVVLSLAVLWGVAGALMVVVTLSMAARLIGNYTDSSAFVYGGMSFADKITNGFAVLLIQELTRVGCEGDDCSEYYRLVVSLGLMVPLFMAMLALFLLNQERVCSLLHGSSGLVVQDSGEHDGLLSSSSYSSSDGLLLGPGVTLGYGTLTKA
ncbi:major facilitator superfamily domain-containing protein 12-like isoform X1 [Scylla paramamosain]|uniref:major facilitator superfamily domain-containing protein 12-like isoform X1 n=2 Tax=Scylla paramamosain TaxID=85552 RepID=UPI0030836291